jgi:hypothetical protein
MALADSRAEEARNALQNEMNAGNALIVHCHEYRQSSEIGMRTQCSLVVDLMTFKKFNQRQEDGVAMCGSEALVE